MLPHALSREYILAKPVLLIFDHMLTGPFLNKRITYFQKPGRIPLKAGVCVCPDHTVSVPCVSLSRRGPAGHTNMSTHVAFL